MINPHDMCRASYRQQLQIVKRKTHKLCLLSEIMDYKKVAGERIRHARESRNLSRPELAAMIKGLGVSTLSNYELGLRYPSPAYLAALSEVLDEPAGYLAGIENDPRASTLLRMYKKMDSRGKETLHRVAESQSAPYDADEHKNKNTG